MNRVLKSLIILTFLEITSWGCANPKSPTGGVKDTIPPILLASSPDHQSIRFNSKEISLTFDENIQADKLKQNLIITPITQVEYKSIVKKNKITILLEDRLDDSTTYTFNFVDGIVDITERNPAQNLIIAFSTGSFIDSLQVSGRVYDINDYSPLHNVTVGLYKYTDTLDVTDTKPTYFLKTSKDGNFLISNIKSGHYRLITFLDENNNMFLDPASENYGFMPDTLSLDKTNLDSINIPNLTLDFSDLKLLSARPSTHYFNIRYSKAIIDYQIINDSKRNYYSKIHSEESNEIRVYNRNMNIDSTQLVISASDTLNNTTIDTVYAKFRPSSKQLEPLTASLGPKSSIPYQPSNTLTLSFNKPILTETIIHNDFLTLYLDSVLTIPLPVKDPSANDTKTEIIFRSYITEKMMKDTIASYLKDNTLDTLNIDSTQLLINNRLRSYNTNKIRLKISEGTFISVENDTSQLTEQTYSFPSTTETGTILINLDSVPPSYNVQVMKESNVIQSQHNCQNCKFDYLKPGNYWIRILIDTNQDGHWSPGNITKNIPPEPIKYFPEETNLRANWQVELNYSLLITH